MKVNKMSDQLHQRVLGWTPKPISNKAQREMTQTWASFGLSEAVDLNQPVEIPLPKFLEDYKTTINKAVEAYGSKPISRLDRFCNMEVPELPPKPPVAYGWLQCRFGSDTWTISPIPKSETAMVLDFETVEIGDKWYPFCCAALTDKSWYIWTANLDELPTAIDFYQDQVVVGHNVGYDRALLKSEYSLKPSGNIFFDTMSAWIAARGFTNQQRSMYAQYDKEGDTNGQDDWLMETAKNGLADVYRFYTGEALDKGTRDGIVTGGMPWIRQNLPEALWYCIKDIRSTFEVFTYVYPELKQSQPSLVSMTAQLMMGNTWLPLSADRWDSYYAKAENQYQEIKTKTLKHLKRVAITTVRKYCPLAGKTTALITNELEPEVVQHCADEGVKFTKKRLNEAVREYVHTQVMKPVEPSDPQLAQLDWTLVSTGANRGYPRWFSKYLGDDSKPLTMNSRIIPLLLGCTWRDEPVLWSDEEQGWYTESFGMLPHPEKRGKALSNLFMQKNITHAESGLLSASGGLKELLLSLISCVNWVSLRKRVASVHTETPEGFPVVLPQIVVTGTVTRRCKDNLWQVASNPKATRIGTELKSMIEAPTGYTFVGADVDSQELWIAAALGDSQLGYCGSTPLGLMVLIGDKKQKTDPHSVVGRDVGVARDDSKTLVYGSLYGQGLRGCIDVIAKANITTPIEEVKTKAEKFLTLFKGQRSGYTKAYVGGLASESFNIMEGIANSACPTTPALGAKISAALRGIREFQTSRVNWTIQSSGVDFRDLYVVYLKYFFDKLGVEGRLMMPLHDEFRSCVKDEHVKRAVYACQLAQLMTRAYFIDVLDLDCIPAGIAWHSAVDVDKVWRKSPTADQVTPSQPKAIASGSTLR